MLYRIVEVKTFVVAENNWKRRKRGGHFVFTVSLWLRYKSKYDLQVKRSQQSLPLKAQRFEET